jgi:hypothetical protein
MMVQIFREYGYGLLLAVILAETLGLPIPSCPLVLVAAAGHAVPPAALAVELNPVS